MCIITERNFREIDLKKRRYERTISTFQKKKNFLEGFNVFKKNISFHEVKTFKNNF